MWFTPSRKSETSCLNKDSTATNRRPYWKRYTPLNSHRDAVLQCFPASASQQGRVAPAASCAVELATDMKTGRGHSKPALFRRYDKGKTVRDILLMSPFFWWAEYDAAFLRWVLRSVLSLVRGFVATSFALVSSVTAFEAPCGAHVSSFTGRTMWHPGRCFDIFQTFMFFTHLIQSSSLFVFASHSIYTRTMLVSSPLCYSDLGLKTFLFALGIRSVRTSISEKY